MRDPSLLDELERDSAPVSARGEIGAAMPTPLSNVETRPSLYPQHGPSHPRDHSLIYRKFFISKSICMLKQFFLFFELM